jgi:septal ring factor EnvC (AmiA/AmiB activator)
MELESNSIIQTISVAALAIIGLVVGAQKLVKEWRSTDAETSVIEMMHKELERMGTQNAKLQEELGKLQREIIELNTQLSKLSIENNKLQEEVSALTIELNSFKKLAALRKVKV